MYEEEPKSLTDVLSVAYGVIFTTVGLLIVVGVALLGLYRSDPDSGVRVVKGPPPAPTIDVAAALSAHPPLETKTFYLVYSPEQARTISNVHTDTVAASASRRFAQMFASFVVLPYGNADETVIAKDVIDRAYADYFAGKGPWVTVVDTANWCRDGAAMPTDWVGVPNEISRAIAGTCSPT